MINRTGLGILCALGAAALYGFIPNFVRTAFDNGVPPIESTVFRTFVLATVFAVFAIARGETLRVPQPAIPSFLGQATATLLVSVCYLASVQFIPVGLAVIIFFFFPVVVMIVAPIAEGRNPGPFRLAIAIAAFAGLAVALGPSFEQLDVRGIGLAAAAAGGAALQFFTGRSISTHMTPGSFGSLVHIVIFPPMLAIALIAGNGRMQFLPGGTATSDGILVMAAMAAIYVFAYMVQMLSLRFAPASTVAPYYNLEPVVTTGIAAAILGERLHINQYAGGGLVLAALAASSFPAQRNR